MNTHYFKNLFIIILATGAVGFSSFQLILNLDREVLFESIESKTPKGDEVFNKITYQETEDKDIWKMKQNHHGLKGEWDEIQIIVDKSEKPYKAYYKQFKKGKEIDYTISCFNCHSNGPRMVRANFESKKVNYSILDKLQIHAWNLKIKHYGEIITPQDKELNGKTRKIFLKRENHDMLRELNIKTCNYCHGKDSFMGRSQLTKQQRGTIIHLLKTKAMPPWPFKLTQKDLQSLKQQLN